MVFLCLLLFVATLGATLVHTSTVYAANPAVCARLGQGETGCPIKENSTDGKTDFPGEAGKCYYFDPGNPSAGTIKNFPGWQENGCNADIFKEALCTSAEKVKQNPKCQRIAVAPDGAIENRCPTQADANAGCDLTKRYLEPAINILAAMVAVVVTASIIAGGIQYASSADDPSKVSQAKSRITNALIALVSFFFLYMFLQWLIPGGFLNV
jgi:hypothetical protein